MSRSRRKVPIFGGGRDGKYWKRHCSGVERTRFREHVAHERWDAALFPALHPGIGGWEWHDGRGYSSPFDPCYCREYWYVARKHQCYYCERYGSRDAWFQRMMRK